MPNNEIGLGRFPQAWGVVDVVLVGFIGSIHSEADL